MSAHIDAARIQSVATDVVRPLYRYANLRRVLDPASIAVVGASPNAASYGTRTLPNLRQFRGKVYLVNPKYDEVNGEACYRSLAALPEIPDCVVIAVARDAVEPVAMECANLGVGGVVIFAAGYFETGDPDHTAKQYRLASIAHQSGMRIIGPNVVGLVNHVCKAGLSFTNGVVIGEVNDHAIGLISQSGGLSNGLSLAARHGVSFSHTLSAGNSCDVDCADFLAYLAEEPHCKAIALVFEGLAHPERLLEAADIARAAGKPVIACKLGRGESAAAAVQSHTGVLAGSAAAYDAAFRRMGAIVVDSYHALVETAAFFAKAGEPSAPGVAILSMSGGSAVQAADAAEERHVPLPQPAPTTAAAMRPHIPDFGSISNPCDVTAAADPFGRQLATADAMLGDPAYGSLVIPFYWATDAFVSGTLKLGDVGLKHRKPVVITWVNEWLEGPGVTEAHLHPGLALFRSTEHAFDALGAWQQRALSLMAPSKPQSRQSPKTAAQSTKSLLQCARSSVLTERPAKEVLGLYGIPVTREFVASTQDEAAVAAQSVGYPVVLKIESPDIPHKTEAGGIRLGLRTDAEVRVAFDDVLANAKRFNAQARISGVLVQRMVPAATEIMIGVRVDPHWGPLIVAGLGGVMVEVLNDSAVELAPVDRQCALDMLARLKGQRVLDGFRGNAPVDRERLADIVVRLSELAMDHAGSIAEIDVNPLICSGSDILAADALITLSGR